MYFFFPGRRRHLSGGRDGSQDVSSADLAEPPPRHWTVVPRPDDLQECRGHLERLSAYFEHRLQRADLPDPIPTAAAQPDVQVCLQASPLHPSHGAPSVGANDVSQVIAGNGWRARTAGGAAVRATSICRLTGCAVRWVTRIGVSRTLGKAVRLLRACRLRERAMGEAQRAI